MPSFQNITTRALDVLHIALFLVSVALIGSFVDRSDASFVLLKVLFFIEGATLTARLWRQGYLSKSPQEIHKGILTTGRRVSSGQFENLTMVVALIAMAIMGTST
jgi:hypothetical protein